MPIGRAPILPPERCRGSRSSHSRRFRRAQGSTAVLQERESAKSWPATIATRKQLIADGTLIEKDGFYEFTRDVQFSSPSAAAAAIEGGSANGLIEWKTKDGVTLKQLDEQA
ncbi:MAG: hypothetical protein DMG62_23955 [Acidobacteria bacterium]|nr:MAG: hypothetical protein DMG62_23955 [Acidobacteriota bacterium]